MACNVVDSNVVKSFRVSARELASFENVNLEQDDKYITDLKGSIFSGIHVRFWYFSVARCDYGR